MARPARLQPASSSLRPSSKLLEAPDKDGENPVNVQPEDTFNMDESGLYYGQQPSRTLARGGLQEIRRTRSA
jgi:hypothetical protein